MKLRKWRLFPVFVSNLLGAAAGEAFEAKVVFKASGDPVAGAEVTVLSSNVTQITAADGTFRWEPTPVVPFEVLVVLPGGKVTYDVTMDAPGDWAFHCHLLYHMHAGMMRVVSVRPLDGEQS